MALSVHPSQKYQSDGGPGVGEISDLFRPLAEEDRSDSAERFFAYLAFYAMIGGTDAHAKNYSMLLSGSRARLAPLYDVASAACYPQHDHLRAPMKLGRATTFLDVTEKDWERVGQRLGMPSGWATETVKLLQDQLPAAFEAAIQALPESAREVAQQQAERIVEHVERRWVPDQEVDPSRVLPVATPGSRL
ncbi:HipA domain-containing protein [Nocardioides dubius]|uniref:HipA-like C-terminal domain-containing protein n=1 Tax=Nocardioides dubius TaxID=317019 RepID=A0ABN1U099_9ACTN